ncbi:hypothetical protein V500_10192 [Pseudogymnoascus sp. VKM F-4518 (FW-2643)]|nr:hypothetical protein V500_10192 [Pseudogymnoascus sp. VKM F-4518 (FW-2643)]
MSFGGSSGLFPRGSNGAAAGPTSPQAKSRSPSDAGGLNWSEQFRERAASAVHRPLMGSSPPAASSGFGSSQERRGGSDADVAANEGAAGGGAEEEGEEEAG